MAVKVLIVDDSSTMRRIIRSTLEKIGFADMIEAEDGVDALTKLDGVGLITLDWNMPKMDGLTFVKSIRSNPKFTKLPIIMVTTEAAKDDILKAIQSGVNNYVVKPFTPQILKQKIDQVLGTAPAA